MKKKSRKVKKSNKGGIWKDNKITIIALAISVVEVIVNIVQLLQ